MFLLINKEKEHWDRVYYNIVQNPKDKDAGAFLYTISQIGKNDQWYDIIY